MKNEIDILKKINDERVKETDILMSENGALKNIQGYSNQEIIEEFKDFVNEVKAWKEEKEKDRLASRKYLNNKKWNAKRGWKRK